MMRILRHLLLVAIVIASPLMLSPSSAETNARGDVRAQIFYDDLAPYGRWIGHRIYGVVWVPGNRARDWGPYTDGAWAWTSDYGWYWESYEPYGWATYHYGRWILTSDYGWVWVPDDVWGPAWVDWRYGDGYVGWSPMPPESRWHNGAMVYARADMSAPEYEPRWVFVSNDNFARGEIRAHRVPPSENRARLSTSARATNYTSVKGRVFNGGVDVKQLSASTKIKIATRSTAVTDKPGVATAGANGSVSIFRPDFAARERLDLTVPQHDTSVPWPTDNGTNVWQKTDIDAAAPIGGAVGAGAQSTIGSEIDRGALPSIGSSGGIGADAIGGRGIGGRGIGGGVIGGGGIGGGLRIGR